MAGADRADRMNRLIQFDGIENARELGGIPVGDGRRVKAGCLIRTGMLASVSARDEERLREEFHVTDIVDLRTDVEISQHPDQTPAGMNYHWHPIFHGKVLGISREEEEAEDPVEKRLIYVRSLEGKAHDSMLRLYPMMVSDPYCVEQLAGFFRLLLAHEEGAFLWHCTAGKDRTGVTAALLLYALGASQETIYEDYLATNEALKGRHQRITREILDRTGDEMLANQAVVLDSVHRDYLTAVFDTIDEKYGGMDNFLTGQLAVTEAERSRLREKYTCLN